MKFEFRIYENDAMLMICDGVDTFQRGRCDIFIHFEHHAEQRSRFSRKTCRKWSRGRTCDVKFEFRVYENDAMFMICDGVDTFQRGRCDIFVDFEHHAEQRSRFSEKQPDSGLGVALAMRNLSFVYTKTA